MPGVLSRAVLGTSFIGAALGLAASSITKREVWSPAVGSSFQIVLSGVVNPSGGVSPNVDIFDVDAFETPADTIQELHAQNKKVICYFSAGTSEDWRSDFNEFSDADKGACLPDWPGERWLNIRSESVFAVMAKRVQMASEKGCDAIDPDNMDGYSNENGGGLGLTQQDSINFLQKLANEASKYGMSTGLKNAQEILPSVKSIIAFAVNEQCALGGDYGSCTPYRDLGKPVYHIEYVNSDNVSESDRATMCLSSDPADSADFTTVIKFLALDGWVTYCDGKSATTPTIDTGRQKAQLECASSKTATLFAA